MTATPFTSSPMEMFNLINLMKEDDFVETDFEEFKREYMTQDLILSRRGVTKLANKMSG